MKSMENSELFNKIHLFIIKNDLKNFKEFFDINIKNVNKDINDIVDFDGETILHDAVYNNNYTFIKFLLEIGADPNKKDKDGHTPTHWLYRIENDNFIEIFILLLKHGADLYIKNNFGKTPLDLCKNKEEIINIIRTIKLDEIYGK